MLACYQQNILVELYFWWHQQFFYDVIFPQGPQFFVKIFHFSFFFCWKYDFYFFYFLVHFWYWDLFKKGSMLQMWAQFFKKIWNPIPYKVLRKLLKFYANWIINEKVIKMEPTNPRFCTDYLSEKLIRENFYKFF